MNPVTLTSHSCQPWQLKITNKAADLQHQNKIPKQFQVIFCLDSDFKGKKKQNKTKKTYPVHQNNNANMSIFTNRPAQGIFI